MRIKKGDYVQVISGVDKGKRGRILKVLSKKNKVLIEGINYIYKHLRKSQDSPKGGRVQKEAPIHVSNVMLYCPHSQSPTRVFYRHTEVTEKDKKSKQTTDENSSSKSVKMRYSRKSNRQV